MSSLAARYRADFPILAQTVNGSPLVYLDNAASTQRPEVVIEEISRYYREDHANVHRGLHTLSTRATAGYETARERVARFLSAPSADSVVFTRGTTEAINLVATVWGLSTLRPGDVILLTELEHHANLIPWQVVAAKTGARLHFLPIKDETGEIDWADLEKLTHSLPVRLIALTHISNSLGCINPINEVTRIARREGIVTLIDAAQSAGHCPLNVVEIDCDFLVFSGHKCCAPTGIGVLYARPGLLDDLPPYQTGGEMIVSVTYEGAQWKPLPHRLEAGTPAIAEAFGLAKALEYLDDVGRVAIAENDHEFGQHAAEALREIPTVRVFGPKGERAGIVSFQLGSIHPHDLVAFADQFGVAMRGGHHCTQPLMHRLGVKGTARASFYFYNEPSEITDLVKVVHAARKYFGD
ncbi:MAG: SufS family cysteine desulfurase [Verrucomicrobia bacterium]|nr:SufS family cysteine desulfurase [Verrucomicrobiota bacterium]